MTNLALTEEEIHAALSEAIAKKASARLTPAGPARRRKSRKLGMVEQVWLPCGGSRLCQVWGFAATIRGKSFRRSGWRTEAEAESALRGFVIEQDLRLAGALRSRAVLPVEPRKRRFISLAHLYSGRLCRARDGCESPGVAACSRCGVPVCGEGSHVACHAGYLTKKCRERGCDEWRNLEFLFREARRADWLREVLANEAAERACKNALHGPCCDGSWEACERHVPRRRPWA